MDEVENAQSKTINNDTYTRSIRTAGPRDGDEHIR